MDEPPLIASLFYLLLTSTGNLTRNRVPSGFEDARTKNIPIATGIRTLRVSRAKASRALAVIYLGDRFSNSHIHCVMEQALHLGGPKC
jgi:hypothetical protein